MHKYYWLLRVLLAVVLMTACHAVGNAQTSGIRVIHLSPDAPNVDFYFDDTINVASANIPFGSATAIKQTDTGYHRVKIAFAGSHPDTAIIDADLVVPSARRISILVLDSLKDLTAKTLNFSLAAAGYVDTTYFRLVNASPNLPVADVRFTDARGNQTTLTNIIFGGATSSFLGLPKGTVRIQVFESLTGDTLADVSGVFEGERFETVILSGYADSLKVQVLHENSPAVQSPLMTLTPYSPGGAGTGLLRFVNAVAGTPNVDVFIDDQSPARVKNIGYRDAGPAIPLSEGEHNVKIALTGLPISSAIFEQAYSGNADTVYTGVGIGSIQTQAEIRILTHPVNLPLIPDSVRVRILHGTSDSPDLDVDLVSGAGKQVHVSPLQWGVVSDYYTMPSGLLTVSLGESGGFPTYLGIGELAGNSAVTLIINGDLNTDNLTVNVLVDSDTSRQAPMDSLDRLSVPTNGVIRIVNVAHNKPVDVYVDNNTSQNLPLDYRDASPTTDDYSGSLNVKFTDRGAGPGSPLFVADVPLITEGLTTLYLITNQQTSMLDSVVLYANEANAEFTQVEYDPTKATIRILNLKNNANFRLRNTSGFDRMYSSVGFKQATKYIQVPAGTLELRAGGLSYMMDMQPEMVYTIVHDDDISLLIDNMDNGQTPMLLLSPVLSVPGDKGGTSNVRVIPNPASTSFAVHCTVTRRGEVSARMVDALGRTVVTSSPIMAEPGELSLSVSAVNVVAGAYTVVVTDAGGERLAVEPVVIVR